MHFITTLLSILLSSTFVSSVPTVKRDTVKVLSDLSIITNNTLLLSTDLASFLNGSATIQTFAQDFTDLIQNINVTTTDVEATGLFNSSDSQAIASQAGIFAQDAINFLVTLMDNETRIDSAGEISLVQPYLNASNTATLDLFTALENAVDFGSIAALTASQEPLGAAFADAIKNYTISF